VHILEKKLLWHGQNQGVFWSIGLNWLLAGAPDKALAAFEKETSIDDRETGTILALHDLGLMDEYEEAFARLREDNGNAEIIAGIYAWVADNDKAFEWLDKMVETGGSEKLRRINRQDVFIKIKADPRWRVLLDRNGYWEKPQETVEFRLTLPSD